MIHLTAIGTLTTTTWQAAHLMPLFINYLQMAYDHAKKAGKEDAAIATLPMMQVKLDAFDWESTNTDIQRGTGVSVSPRALVAAILS